MAVFPLNTIFFETPCILDVQKSRCGRKNRKLSGNLLPIIPCVQHCHCRVSTAALHTRDPQLVCVTASPTQSGVRGFHAAASSAAACWAMQGTVLGKLLELCLGYNCQSGGPVREARIFQFEMELELER